MLVAPIVMLALSGTAGAATPRDWVLYQRLDLNGQAAAHCYDRRSLRKEATVIRVRIKSIVASDVAGDGCSAPSAVQGMSFESELLIRCRDRMWVQTENAQRQRVPEPLPEAQWRGAGTGEHQKLVDRICGLAPGLQDHGSAMYAAATGSAQAKPVPPASEATRRASSGSGFFVDATGFVLTNHHVVQGCRQVTVVAAGKRWRAEIVARDPLLDLALLRTAAATAAYASFRIAAPPRVGETVIAAGFPLRGLLASEPIVSTGIVNAVAGIRDDTTRFQISAPVQPGNSGGPVLDASGNVIGVVVSKLDAVKLAQSTGDIPQNINFAVKGDLARAFLEKNKVTPRTGTWTRPIDTIGVAAIAKPMTIPVDCQ